MRAPLALPLLGALVLVPVACSDDPLDGVVVRPAAAEPPMHVDPEVNQFLLELCKGHGLPARLDGDWVAFDGSAVRMNGGIAPGAGGDKDNVILQVDFRTRLPDGRLVAQPVVGWAEDRAKALASAQASFTLGTFHAVLGAFIDPGEEHVQSQRMVIGGRERIVTFGGTVIKSLGEQEPAKPGAWQEQFMAELATSDLPPGAHWVDVYNGFVGDHQELEIQLDSRRWPEMEQKLKRADWPRAGQFTSVRKFLVIQDVDDPTRPTTRPTTTPATRAATSPAD